MPPGDIPLAGAPAHRAPSAGELDVRVLGPLSVHHGGAEVTPTAQKPCTVLALLLLNHTRVVPVPALIDELWQDVPPKSARAALQIYVSHLRKALTTTTGLSLAEVSADVLQTVHNGYRLVVAPGRFDLETYHRLHRRGHTAMTTGDHRAAAQHFRAALDLWRGPAVADVRPGTRIRAEVAALEQSRLTTRDYRVELDLRLGAHRELLSELAVLTLRDRLHENLHAQYVIALYRSGHRIRALEAFHRLRHNMLAEFGLEPSPRLKELHQAVLTLDPVLDRVEVVPLPRLPVVDLPEFPALAGSF
ncbi:AfsR/SARP family transcriptional regulator [Actinokineospora terrae]|uniref:DNA-binding transcriptional activator of the SARP family n=1 Tax=Actinokineospora terrae TaxID=155974 RepID=A0A1H9MMJ8_9PSEU|nr:AfsR/SARP family transcriptional regulator [Actinokineospora terrae]SER24687.1 DNA-binding transcriptional activator of the SARP family [Actinokineospora terrae]